MSIFWKASPWISKVILLLCAAVFVVISIEPLVHPVASAAAQGIAFTSSLGATIFRVSFAGFPLGCAAFLAYCLLSGRRTLTGLVFSALVLGILLAVRLYGMEVDSTVQQSMQLVKPEMVLVGLALLGVAMEKGRGLALRRAAPTSHPRA